MRSTTVRCLAALAAAGLIVGPAPLARAAAPEPEVRTYIVQPGDSAWSVAEEFYGSGTKYPIIYKYNGFTGRPPYLLQAGQVLKLPVLGKGPEAQVAWLHRDVKAKPPRALDWLTAREQMNLWRLYRVSTGDESAVHIVFEDASDLRLRSNALLVIYGASATAARTERRDKREVVLEQGTLQGGLAQLDAAAAPLVVKTPSGQVDIMGRLTQIQAEALASMVSAFEGQAAVTAQGARVEVPEGQGTVVEKGKKPQPARPLPKAPTWIGGGGKALVAVVEGERGTWEAAWEPVPEAASYRVELATDATFKEVLYDAEVGAGVTRLRLADLAPGSYAVRVGTRDAAKLESKPGPARGVDVLSITASRRLESGPDGVLEAVGFLQVKLAELTGGASEGAIVAVDGRPEQSAAEPLALTAPGLYKVRFKAGEAEGTLDVRVLGVRARLAPPAAPLARGEGAPQPVELVIEDERGRPALLPGLVVETSDGRAVALEQTGPATYRAGLGPVPEDGPLRLAVRARWLGGELASEEVQVVPPPPAPVVIVGRAPLALTPYRAGRAQPQALGKPTPESRLALDSVLIDEDPGAGRLGLTLAGELALGAVALEADLLFADVRMEEGDDPQARIGDLSLGARWAAVDAPDVALAPYLRVGLPTGPRASSRLLALEPGVALRLGGSGSLFADLKVALVHGNDLADASTTRLAGILAAAWRPADIVTFAISGQVRAGLDDDFVGTVIGLGSSVDLDALRLGFAFGLGLGDDGRAGLGSLFGRLLVEVGL